MHRRRCLEGGVDCANPAVSVVRLRVRVCVRVHVRRAPVCTAEHRPRRACRARLRGIASPPMLLRFSTSPPARPDRMHFVTRRATETPSNGASVHDFRAASPPPSSRGHGRLVLVLVVMAIAVQRELCGRLVEREVLDRRVELAQHGGALRGADRAVPELRRVCEPGAFALQQHAAVVAGERDVIKRENGLFRRTEHRTRAAAG